MFRWVRARATAAESEPEGDTRGLGPMVRFGLIGPNGQVRPEVFDTSDGSQGPDFEGAVDELAKLLGARQFFFSDELSRADLAAFGSLVALRNDRYPGSAALLRAHPNLWEHCERVEKETGGA